LVSGLDHLTAGVAIIAKTLAQVSDAIPAVQGEIANAEKLATHYGYQLDDNGQIIDTLTNPGPNDPSPPGPCPSEGRDQRHGGRCIKDCRRYRQ
jgi:hypothetical protein